jgi:plastocyanin
MVMISLQNSQFVPADVTIKAGQSVMWTSNENVPHTVTSGTGPTDPSAGASFDQQLPSSGATFTQQFTSPGVFPYFCRFHFAMGMKGTVTVTP